MDLIKRMDLALRAPTEEIVTREELKELFETNAHPTHYIGFELSGLLHAGFIMAAFKINDLIEAEVKCKVYLADWHSVINNKFGGDWNKIKKAAEYFADAFQFFCPGVETVLGTDLYHCNDEYWKQVILFGKQITLARDVRCLAIMGRTEKEKLDVAQYLYPLMQAVDIHAIGADIAHAGIDQRKVHMLAREVYPKLGWKKPVALHHHLLPGLGEPARLGFEEDKKADEVLSSKMSKSKPQNCVFIHDSEQEILAKMQKAYCPPSAEGNPVLEFAKHLVFHEFDSVDVEREQKYGGDVTFENYEQLEQHYAAGKLHASDLKNAVAQHLNKIVSPLRAHFEKKKNLLDAFREGTTR
jgi:tyrosyl-tRNA synthetase